MTKPPKLQDLERRLAEEPEDHGLRAAVADALCEAGRYEEAVAQYRAVALAYRDQGRVPQAIAACRSLLDLAPDDAGCRALLDGLEAGSGGERGERGAGGARKLPLPAAGVAVPRPTAGVVVPRAVRAPARPETEPPARRSSFDETPLPPAMPHHVADPTLRLRRISESDLPTAEGAPTRPGTEDGLLPEISGIANAARRISATLIGARAQAGGDRELSDALALLEEPTAVPAARRGSGAEDGGEDEGDEDDQTQPRDLPLGVRSWAPEAEAARPVVKSPLAFAFFAPLPAERREGVLARFSRRSVPPGTVVIRQGEVMPSFVLVASGRLEVRAEHAGVAIGLPPVGPGEHIGEAPLLARAPSRASVIAATEAELLLLSPRDFYDVAGTFPALWAALKEAAERRTREHDARR